MANKTSRERERESNGILMGRRPFEQVREYGKTDGVDGRTTNVEWRERKFLLPPLNADDGRGRRGQFSIM